MSSITEARLKSIEDKLDLIISKLNLQDSNLDTISNSSTSSPKNTEKTKSKPRAKKGTKSTPSGNIIKKGNIKVDVYNDTLLVTGETYDRKDLIKSLGGRWNATYKGWTIPASNKEDALSNLETYCISVDRTNKSSSLLSKESVKVNSNDVNSDLDTVSQAYDIDSD